MKRNHNRQILNVPAVTLSFFLQHNAVSVLRELLAKTYNLPKWGSREEVVARLEPHVAARKQELEVQAMAASDAEGELWRGLEPIEGEAPTESWEVPRSLLVRVAAFYSPVLTAKEGRFT